MAAGTPRDSSVEHPSQGTRRSSAADSAEQGRGDEGETREQSERYDFERLERSVEYLLDEHARLGAEREAILAELADREHRVAQLEAEVVTERQRRAAAVEGVDKILSRLEQLQASVALPSDSNGVGDAAGLGGSRQESSEALS